MEQNSGNRLKEVSDELFGGNQSEMARMMGMSPQALNKYFQGERAPGIKILKRLVSIGINANWVLTGNGTMFLNRLDRDSELTALEDQGLKRLNDRIRWVRIRYKKTLSEMAMLCAVSIERQTLIEKGEKEPWEEYIDRLLHEFDDVRREWLITNEEPKLKSTPVNEPGQPEPYINRAEFGDLSDAESLILDEVTGFSEFLRTKPLHPTVKRMLIQRLVESIDQAIEQLRAEDTH